MKLISIVGMLLLSTGASAQSQCPSDVKICPDGQTMNRNPTNDCKFALCQGEKDCSSAGSPEDYLMCPSGSRRYRDGFNNCEFAQCDDPRCEMEDSYQCPSPYLNVFMARDPKAGHGGCQDWLPCPGSGTPEQHGEPPKEIKAATQSAQSQCPSDVKICPDGQTMNRNPTNDCKFALCQGEKDCSSANAGGQENYLICPSGSRRYRDGFNNCEFAQCDDPRCEMEDSYQCPSPYLYVFMARDPKAGHGGCQDWLPCPGSGTPEQHGEPPKGIKALTKNLRARVFPNILD